MRASGLSCVIAVVVGGAGCAPSDVGTVPFDGEHKLRALELISVFENGTVDLQFDYVEALGDGRGFTCGLGFTTATGDALEVVQRYTDDVADNALAPFLPELQRLAGEESGDTSGLTGFPDAWQQAAADTAFHDVEIAVQDENSYDPALAAAADDLGLKSALGLFIVFDTFWMHGDGDDDDGAPAIIARTKKKAAPSDEVAFLHAFLDERRADLAHAFDADTRDVWAEAVPRADVALDILNAGNLAFDGPIDVARGYDVRVP